MVVLLMLIPLLAPSPDGAAVGFATISKALGCVLAALDGSDQSIDWPNHDF